MIDQFKQYLNNGDLVEDVIASNGKDAYVMPARRNAGHLAIALIREIVAPTVFRNAEEEVTDIEDRGRCAARAGDAEQVQVRGARPGIVGAQSLECRWPLAAEPHGRR